MGMKTLMGALVAALLLTGCGGSTEDEQASAELAYVTLVTFQNSLTEAEAEKVGQAYCAGDIDTVTAVLVQRLSAEDARDAARVVDKYARDAYCPA